MVPNPNRQALEALWRSRLVDARLRLDFARSFMHEVQENMGAKDIPAADGTFAHQQALRGQTHALAHYRRVLRIYTDLTLRGWIPDEAEWQRLIGE